MDPEQPDQIRRNGTGPFPQRRQLSTEASIIPGESEEDGLLRREYVMVGDNQTIEFRRTVDGAILLFLTQLHSLIRSQKLLQGDGDNLRT